MPKKETRKKVANKKPRRPKVKKADLALDIAELRNELKVLRAALETLQSRLNELEVKLSRAVISPWQPAQPWPTWPHPGTSWGGIISTPPPVTNETEPKPVYAARGSSTWGSIGSGP